MSLLLRHALAWAVVLPAATTAQAQTPWPPVPALSAHRGASALYPEMTQPAFAQALQDGADLLELDVVLSRDGVPVVRHDAALAAPEVGEGMPFATTDVATRPEFAQRKTTKTVDGVRQTGWFAEDFTLQELKTLRTVERFAQLRPGSAAHDGQHPLLTLQEVADLAKAHTARTGRPAGLLIELKHAAYLQAQGLDLGRALLEFLERNQWSSAQAPVIVQSFEVQVLKELRARSPCASCSCWAARAARRTAPRRARPMRRWPPRKAWLPSPPMPRAWPCRASWRWRWTRAAGSPPRRPRGRPRRPAWPCTSGRCGRKTSSCPRLPQGPEPCGPGRRAGRGAGHPGQRRRGRAHRGRSRRHPRRVPALSALTRLRAVRAGATRWATVRSAP